MPAGSPSTRDVTRKDSARESGRLMGCGTGMQVWLRRSLRPFNSPLCRSAWISGPCLRYIPEWQSLDSYGGRPIEIRSSSPQNSVCLKSDEVREPGPYSEKSSSDRLCEGAGICVLTSAQA
jgi:hypothetical protein